MKHISLTTRGTSVQSSILLGRGIASRAAELLETTQFSSIAIISDGGAPATTNVVMSALSVPENRHLRLPGGELCKSVDTLSRVWEFLSSCHLDRQSLVLAIGGGAITDLVGFAASTYMRGVAFVAIPTTLLAQVDASIGGKTGINLGGTKNMVGTIRQPLTVIIDTEALSTLPTRELRSGFAEIVKHGLIADKSYYKRVTSRPCTDWSAEELVEILVKSCQIKCATVEADECESGARKSLNFGHTLGHAIEALALRQGEPMTHGEAVSIGIHAATFLSRAVGRCTTTELEEVVNGLKVVGLPTSLAVAQAEHELLELITHDKKNIRGESRWTLLNGIGSCVWDIPLTGDLVRQAIAAVQPS